MAAMISNFFKRKPQKFKPTEENRSNESDDDDEGYQDPINSCPTEPPTRIPVPNYPPPRPGSPKTVIKAKDDYQDPWDSKSKKEYDAKSKGVRKPDTYQDPFDAKMKSSQEDYADPFDTKFGKEKERRQLEISAAEDIDDYDEPYESKDPQNEQLNSTYEDPWDTKRKFELANDNDRPKSMTSSEIINIKKKPQNSKDDYSDPWDSKISSSLNEEYDDTYSEPYDQGKQSILDEAKRKSMSVSTPGNGDGDDDDDLYDMPYEERLAIGIANPPSDSRSQFRQQKSHSDASIRKPPPKASAIRPPSSALAPMPGGGDYDSPWEWKVDKVEKEFEKRFSVRDQSNQPKAAPRKKPGANPNINPVEKPLRVHSSSDTVTYQVDPTIPLENQGWFHGHIRRGEAEKLLHNQPDCSYLIRNSESSKIDYSLSLRNRGEPMHLKISCRDGKYILGINSRPYDTIQEMIHHYSMNMLNIRGAEHVKLSYPVFQENMYFTVEPGS